MNSRLKVSDWLIIGAAAVMLILGISLDWATIEGASGNGPFDYFFTGGLAWLLVVGSGVVVALLASRTLKATTAPWTLILVAATGLATLLMLLRILLGGGDVEAFDQEFELDRGAGMWIALLAAAVALAGAVMKFTEAGGNLRDLTDVDKLRDSFDRPDDLPPPPPPATGSNPPPPPPAV